MLPVRRVTFSQKVLSVIHCGNAFEPVDPAHINSEVCLGDEVTSNSSAVETLGQVEPDVGAEPRGADYDKKPLVVVPNRLDPVAGIFLKVMHCLHQL